MPTCACAAPSASRPGNGRWSPNSARPADRAASSARCRPRDGVQTTSSRGHVLGAIPGGRRCISSPAIRLFPHGRNRTSVSESRPAARPDRPRLGSRSRGLARPVQVTYDGGDSRATPPPYEHAGTRSAAAFSMRRAPVATREFEALPRNAAPAAGSEVAWNPAKSPIKAMVDRALICRAARHARAHERDDFVDFGGAAYADARPSKRRLARRPARPLRRQGARPSHDKPRRTDGRRARRRFGLSRSACTRRFRAAARRSPMHTWRSGVMQTAARRLLETPLDRRRDRARCRYDSVGVRARVQRRVGKPPAAWRARAQKPHRLTGRRRSRCARRGAARNRRDVACIQLHREVAADSSRTARRDAARRRALPYDAVPSMETRSRWRNSPHPRAPDGRRHANRLPRANRRPPYARRLHRRGCRRPRGGRANPSRHARAAPPDRWSRRSSKLMRVAPLEAVVDALFAQPDSSQRANAAPTAASTLAVYSNQRRRHAPVSLIPCKQWNARKVGVKEVRELRGVWRTRHRARPVVRPPTSLPNRGVCRRQTGHLPARRRLSLVRLNRTRHPKARRRRCWARVDRRLVAPPCSTAASSSSADGAGQSRQACWGPAITSCAAARPMAMRF